MGTELVRAAVKDEDIDFPAVPPGFELFTSLKLKRMEETKKEVICSLSASVLEHPVQAKAEMSHNDVRKVSRSLRCRSWINYDQCNNDSDDDCDSELLDQRILMKPLLPKGVFRGCSDCSTCQKVVAKCQPEAARQPDLEDVPVFYPSEEEFQDTINYITKIRPMAEPYGICRIVPPSSWKPPCQLQEKNIWENSKFFTRVQRVDKLQNRDPTRKMSRVTNHMRKKRQRCSKIGMDTGSVSGNVLNSMELEFGFEPGPGFTLDEFQRYADDFKAQYFEGIRNTLGFSTDNTKHPGKGVPSIETIEGEYWRVVEKPTEEIEVLYGADLETGSFGSGFPRTVGQGCSPSGEQYVKSGWNLNNLPRLPGSVLTYENPDISGVQVPWLYIGMCFSSFCWHVEDHFLYSLNYMHFGAPKLWYGVPGKDATKLEDAMRKHLPDLFNEQPDLLHKLVTQLSPTILKAEGVPVYRCIQNPGEFVLTFPRAYHAGFNCGFNCAEAVNVAPLDWFPHGQNAVELYREQGRKTTISHDKLLLAAAKEAVKANWELNLLRKNTADNMRWKDACGRNGILAKSLRARVDMERVRRDFLCKSPRALKMLSSFDATTERECSICFFDLHLSAAACRCSPDKYVCLSHVKQLCPCSWTDKFFLFRYDIDELVLLVEAIEGKLSAIYRWARSYLGFSLSCDVTKDNMQVSGLISFSSPRTKEVLSNEAQPSKEASAETPSRLTLHMGKKACAVGGKQNESLSPAKDVKVITINLSEGAVPAKFRIKRDVQKHDSNSQSSIVQKQQLMKKPSFGEDVICLSDDEGNQSDKPLSSSAKVTKTVRVKSDENLDLCDKDATSISTRIENNVKCEGQSLSKEPNVSFDQAASGPVANRYVQGPSNSKGIVQSVVGLSGQQINKTTEEAWTLRVDQTKMVDEVRSLPGSPSCSQNSLDKYYRQKGPRIAKVVRRINCNVESVELGIVVSKNSWSNSQAIFPKGFRSRVRYTNILDPTILCYYISEVVDGGSRGPLFMVSLEHCPSEVFVHISPTMCWEMVLDRVNHEISKQHKLGRLKLPPLQPPGSLDGFEMFGFTSPSIVQAIEALDRNRVCREYWNSRPLANISQCFRSEEGNIQTAHSKCEDADVHGSDVILRGLFKKASPEELQSLLGFLKEGRAASGLSFVNELLNEEIYQRLR